MKTTPPVCPVGNYSTIRVNVSKVRVISGEIIVNISINVHDLDPAFEAVAAKSKSILSVKKIVNIFILQ